MNNVISLIKYYYAYLLLFLLYFFLKVKTNYNNGYRKKILSKYYCIIKWYFFLTKYLVGDCSFLLIKLIYIESFSVYDDTIMK